MSDSGENRDGLKAKLLRFVAKKIPPNQGPWPSSQNRQRMEPFFRNPPSLLTCHPFVPTVKKEGNDANYNDISQIDQQNVLQS